MSGFSFTEPFRGNNEDTIHSKFNDMLNEFNNKLNSFLKNTQKSGLLTANPETLKKIYLIESRGDFLWGTCKDFFDKNKNYIFYQIAGKNFFQYLQNFFGVIDQVSPEVTSNDVGNVLISIQELFQVFQTIKNIAENEKKADELISELKEQVLKASKSVESVISAKEALENKPTEDIYRNVAKKYINTARFYDVTLLLLLATFYHLTSQFFQNFQMFSDFITAQESSSAGQTIIVFFFITKLTIVSIVITLATICIRRSSHFRKLHGQANQTSLELSALPNYLRQVDSNDHSEIYKELIPKFFGKEIDQTQNNKIGDLVQDQLLAGTELIKASAEMVKNVKSSGGSTEANQPPKS
ncbi:hypothetical protein [Acinetobacter junii]|uniref:hypothetical protein n=1 Tax=Acinetobacter junii TaxID=40215 RepID=UPI001BC87AC6|nr:hypothetical protein [Acinetobacter junii]